MDDATAAQVRALVTKGAVGGPVLHHADAQGTYETLKGRGVEITDEPSPKPYGIDFGIRDPFGNAIRIGQIFDAPSLRSVAITRQQSVECRGSTDGCLPMGRDRGTIPDVAVWEPEGENWIRWAWTPGFDAYWYFRDAVFDAILPTPEGLTLEVGPGAGRVTRDLVARGHDVVAPQPRCLDAGTRRGAGGSDPAVRDRRRRRAPVRRRTLRRRRDLQRAPERDRPPRHGAGDGRGPATGRRALRLRRHPSPTSARSSQKATAPASSSASGTSRHVGSRRPRNATASA